ncbi:hypothetical protein NI18_16025 [Sphingomonas sp. Ant20]|nr:hypothetical protein NI18_16025 [Sphingomonas sp. Ant20]
MTKPRRTAAQSRDVVYDALLRAARAGARCPTNLALAALLGVRSSSIPQKALVDLIAAGKIVVTTTPFSREILIPELGATIRASKAPDGSKRETDRAEAIARAERREPLPPVLDRTPCFRCGIRADLGCDHQPASAPHIIDLEFAA